VEGLIGSRVSNPRNGIFVFTAFVFGAQIFVLPLLFDPSNIAKFLLASMFCFLILLFAPLKEVPVSFFDGPFLLLLLVLLLSSSISPYRYYSSIAFLSIIVIASYKYLADRFFLIYQTGTILFLRFFSVFVLCVALLGLYEFFHFLLVGKSTEPLIPYLLPPDLTMRVVGVYGQPNLFALLLLVGLVAYVYLYLYDESFLSCRLRVFYYLPMLVVSIVFFLTGSRAGQVAMAMTFFPLCLLVTRHPNLKKDSISKKRFFYLIVFLAFGYIISFFLTNYFSYSTSRGFSDTGVSSEARFVFWLAASFIFRDHPLLGVGLDNFKYYLPQYVKEAHQALGFVQYEAMGYTHWAHNELLQLICEGGIVVLLILLLVLSLFFRQLFLFTRGQMQWPPLKLYSHFFILPFIFQSLFSWPLRHPSLLVLFFTFLVILLRQYEVKILIVPRWFVLFQRSIAFCGMCFILLFLIQQVKAGIFEKQMTPDNAQEGFVEFTQLAASPYSAYPLLLKITPRYVQVAVLKKDCQFAEQILPYVKKLTDLQGAYWQWYNLALVYQVLGRDEESMSAITRAIELRPTDEMYWAFQHYLNMKKASMQTGRSIDDFLPIPPGGSAQNVKEKYEFFDRIQDGK